jgi:hypothetical protein
MVISFALRRIGGAEPKIDGKVWTGSHTVSWRLWGIQGQKIALSWRLEKLLGQPDELTGELFQGI